MTEEELVKLEAKVKWYGHYAEFLRVQDLINEIHFLKDLLEL